MVVPGVDATEEAGKLLEHLPDLWTKANLKERREILMTMLDAVYVDAVEEKRVVGLKPKPAFRPLFEIAVTREGSDVVLLTDPPPAGCTGETDTPCLWWRRGRVDLFLKREFLVWVIDGWPPVLAVDDGGSGKLSLMKSFHQGREELELVLA